MTQEPIRTQLEHTIRTVCITIVLLQGGLARVGVMVVVVVVIWADVAAAGEVASFLLLHGGLGGVGDPTGGQAG